MSESNRTRPASARQRRLVVLGKLLLGLLVPMGLCFGVHDPRSKLYAGAPAELAARRPVPQT
jgi:hypothetical protein